jgi:GT2 family glycosyltransferase
LSRASSAPAGANDGSANARVDVSVLIVNWNTRELLAACLESVRRQEGARVEVIVVDNGSADGSAEMVRTRFPAVTLLPQASNLGFARGTNAAARAARGRYLLLLNSDTELRPGALARAVAHADARPAVGALGLGLENPDGSRQPSCAAFPTVGKELFYSLGLHVLLPRRVAPRYRLEKAPPARAATVDWVTGAALLIRRDAWEAVGALDEQIFMYAEDLDWCLRATRDGFAIAYEPAARVLHHGDASSRLRWRDGVNRAVFRQLRYVVRKHGGAGRSFSLALAITVGAVPRWILFAVAARMGAAPRRPFYRRRAATYLATLAGLWGRNGRH